MKLNEEQMAIIEKADKLTKCYSSTIEETHWLNEEEAYSLIESFVEIMDTPLNKQVNQLHNKLDAQDKIINSQALEIARLKETIKEYEDRFKLIKKIVNDNIFEELDSLSYACMLSTISDVCDGKTGFLEILGDKE